jgi:hypothetical protein
MVRETSLMRRASNTGMFLKKLPQLPSNLKETERKTLENSQTSVMARKRPISMSRNNQLNQLLIKSQ